MRRIARRAFQRGSGDITSIAVAFGLNPRPSVHFLEYADRIAKDHLGLRPAIHARFGPQIDNGGGNLHGRSGGKTRRFHLTGQPFIGEVGTVGVETAVEHGQSGNSLALAITRSPSLST